MIRMTSLALLLTLSAIGIDPDTAAAFADLKQQPQGYYAYATVSTEATAGGKQRLAEELAFVVCSLSSRSYLGDQIPQHVPGTDLYRLDLTGLGWQKHWNNVLVAHYPYRPELTKKRIAPLVVKASWIVAELPDPVQTGDAQYLLLYGFVPKTGADFRKFWKVSAAGGDTFGFLEGRSGVQAKGAQRLMMNRDTSQRAAFFETFDSKRVAGKTSPAEKIVPGTLTYDGQELIVGIPKHYNGEGGTLQAYFLNNGNSDPDKRKHDTRVDVAPPDLVKDADGLRGYDIRNGIDCMACHTKGMQDPTVDEYRALILGGQRIYADKITKAEIERFYQSPFAKELKRADEDYATAIRLVNGLTPQRNAAQFVACIKAHDADLDLAQAAREVYCTPDELKLAIANYSPNITEALAGLAQRGEITRDEWVDAQPLLQCVILPAWRTKK